MNSNWYNTAASEVADFDFQAMSYNNTCYHGTFFGEDGFFDELDAEMSDFGAIWVTPDEIAAEGFSENGSEEGTVRGIFKINVNLRNIVIIDKSPQWKTFRDMMGCEDDLRDCIPYLERQGYDGWFTTGWLGSYDSIIYEDIAIFGGGNFSVQSVKLFVDGKWTEYMSVAEAKELIENFSAPADELVS